ncbi:MAG: hypothetical protein H8E79_05985 [Desulfobulbaceae bacterium]|uniref:Uncharacterized protein n=1 Tax=Candidatus Desulfatifera sulfidica TaxID=2841691 RepID=A0A8J6NAY6_9BACT|nr:hypothetical protein [Candidatus Desulfatifera sulfidica]
MGTILAIFGIGNCIFPTPDLCAVDKFLGVNWLKLKRIWRLVAFWHDLCNKKVISSLLSPGKSQSHLCGIGFFRIVSLVALKVIMQKCLFARDPCCT